MNTESDTPRTDKAVNESIAAVYETSKELEKELNTCKDLVEHYSKLATSNGIDAGIAQNALKKERELVSRDYDKLRELNKQITQILR
jgi:archaellum component FlaC